MLEWMSLLFVTTVISLMHASDIAAVELNNTSTSLIDYDKNDVHRRRESIEVANCPKGCHCKLKSDELTIWKCTSDPLDKLPKLFSHYPNVSHLQIRDSYLSKVPCSVSMLPKLKKLTIPQNNIEHLPLASQCLPMKNLSLVVIDLTSNKFTTLRNGSLYDYRMLENIYLENNNIKTIQSDVFMQTKRLGVLKRIILNFNKIEILDSWPLQFIRLKPGVTIFQIQNNPISKFTNNAKFSKTNCTTIRDHSIIYMSNITLSHITDLFTGWNIDASRPQDIRQCFLSEQTKIKMIFYPIQLFGAPLNCDCVDYAIYSALHGLNITNLRCKSPEYLQGKNPIEIPLEQFICNIPQNDNCPQSCTCTDTPHLKMILLTCNSFQGHNIPQYIPKLPTKNYSYTLNFTNSRLDILNSKPYLGEVVTAVFSRSSLNEITLEAFESFGRVEVLHLDHNNLKRLPEGIGQVKLNKTKEIWLGHNKWVCDCNSIEMKNWIVAQWGTVKDKEHIICASPPKWKENNLVDMEKSKLCEIPNSINTFLIIGLSLFGALLCVSITSCIMCGIKHRVWIYKKSKWHPFQQDECEHEDKIFDVFLCYADEDEDYASTYLIPGLEEKGFKVCFHQLHFCPGKSIIESICDAIQNSKRILVFFTTNLSLSEYSMYAFSLAMRMDLKNNTRRLICIKGNDLDINELESAPLTYFHSWGTYIEQDHPQFWDNLLYVLPTKPLGAAIVEIEEDINEEP